MEAQPSSNREASPMIYDPKFDPSGLNVTVNRHRLGIQRITQTCPSIQQSYSSAESAFSCCGLGTIKGLGTFGYFNCPDEALLDKDKYPRLLQEWRVKSAQEFVWRMLAYDYLTYVFVPSEAHYNNLPTDKAEWYKTPLGVLMDLGAEEMCRTVNKYHDHNILRVMMVSLLNNPAIEKYVDIIIRPTECGPHGTHRYAEKGVYLPKYLNLPLTAEEQRVIDEKKEVEQKAKLAACGQAFQQYTAEITRETGMNVFQVSNSSHAVQNDPIQNRQNPLARKNGQR